MICDPEMATRSCITRPQALNKKAPETVELAIHNVLGKVLKLLYKMVDLFKVVLFGL